MPVPGLLQTVGPGWPCLPPPRPGAAVGSGAGLSLAAGFWDTCSWGFCAPRGCFPSGSGCCLSTFPELPRETLSAL